MDIHDLLWDETVVEKIERKHHVSREEVEAVFFEERPHIRRFGSLYYAYGRTAEGRFLFIPFIPMGKGIVRPITARDMTDSERRLFKSVKE